MQLNNFRAFFSLRTRPILFCFIIFFSGCMDHQDLVFTPDLNLAPSCSDGIKNQDETGIDCGGTCKDVCGEQIIAECSSELGSNTVISDDFDHKVSISRINVFENYNGDGYSRLFAMDEASVDIVTVLLPFKSFPTENAVFTVGKNLSIQEGGLVARVEVEENGFYYGRVSVEGELYLRVEKDKIHIEFCDMWFESEDNYDYVYQGSMNFLISDIK